MGGHFSEPQRKRRLVRTILNHAALKAILASQLGRQTHTPRVTKPCRPVRRYGRSPSTNRTQSLQARWTSVSCHFRTRTLQLDFGGGARALRLSLLIPRQKRCYSANGDPPIRALRFLRLDLQELLSITLRHQVFWRYIKPMGESGRDRLSPPIR